MSRNIISISEIKRSLLNDLSILFPENEAFSITKLILEHFGYSEISILRDPSVIVEDKIHSEIKKIVHDLNQNKPIQYILGETWFFDLRFIVNENVLIPRQETEELVSKILLENNKTSPVILDIGTGSGCIAITIAHSIKESSVFAMEVDKKALEVAELNAIENKIHLTFIQKSIFESGLEPKGIKFDIIISNPPYVTPEDKMLMSRNVLDFEPKKALFTPENDPLIFYREIISYANKKLNEDGAIWVEINEKLGEETKKLFLEGGYSKVRLMKDIHGKDRFIKAMR